ncbi:MAG: NAD-dependent epimerase/dehydratase family protein [Candidatus Woesearchaeota archaeon]|nr:NAD-dependent epimerase/dehydratase family protein [Candidatus Woesearchaeota archaeon]
MEPILVTGGAGFIGSHVCKKLLEKGYRVVCVDNLNDYYNPDIKKKNVEHLCAHAEFVFYHADILDVRALDIVFEKEHPTRIIHLAARAGVRPSLEQPNLYANVNIRGTLNVLECARRQGIRRVVFGSSSSVYGLNTTVPFLETDDVANQASPYGVSKRAGELYCYNYHHLYGLSIACLRFFTVYGPSGRPDMAPYKFTKLISEGKSIELFGDGTSQRDYTYVDDIVQGVVAALEHPDIGFEIINLGDSRPVPLKQFIAITEEAVGKKASIVHQPFQHGDVPVTFANIEKARALLGYAPETPLEQGMAHVVAWFNEQKKKKQEK